MKKYVIKFIEKYLFDLAQKRLKDKKITIIAVTGSVGKTSTKEAIRVLMEHFFADKVFVSHGNMNESVGIPLAILGFDYLPTKSGWPKMLFEARKKAKSKKFPNYLVLEMGVEKPGDINYFTKLVKPDIALITNIGPAHLENLKDLNGVLTEKTQLFEALNDGGTAIYCQDDKKLVDYSKNIKHKKISYGFSEDATIKGKIVRADGGGSLLEVSSGTMKKQLKTEIVGRHLLEADLAAMAIASALGLDFDKALASLKDFKPLPGRMRLLAGTKNTQLIDDSYNANPVSVLAALETFEELSVKGRKVAILGNMNELGDLEQKSHKIVGAATARVCDFAVFIGPNAQLMKEAAELEAQKINHNNFKAVTFDTTSRAVISLDELILENDTILIKASQNKMRFEKIVETLMADPSLAKGLLVRQDARWRK